jgi:hypothetical protein
MAAIQNYATASRRFLMMVVAAAMAFGFGAAKCKLSLLRRDWKKPRHEVGFRVWLLHKALPVKKTSKPVLQRAMRRANSK